MILQTLRFILNHPVNRNRPVGALWEWLRWQVGSRCLPGPAIVPFVNDAVLVVEPGMTGATGNIYTGLVEFEDMGFVLHFLKPEDLFLDVGANVGVYTILAAKGVGARCISVEALKPTFEKFQSNVLMNDIGSLVTGYNCAVGAEEGELNFTSSMDTMNRVMTDSENRDDLCQVPVKRLDDLLEGAVPRLIKIDVEGYETPVVEGAAKTLSSTDQYAVIMELNGCGSKYGFDDQKLHDVMIGYGYIAVRYEPFSRELELMSGPNAIGNTLYARKTRLDEMQRRLVNAVSFRVKGLDI